MHLLRNTVSTHSSCYHTLGSLLSSLCSWFFLPFSVSHGNSYFGFSFFSPASHPSLGSIFISSRVACPVPECLSCRLASRILIKFCLPLYNPFHRSCLVLGFMLNQTSRQRVLGLVQMAWFQYNSMIWGHAVSCPPIYSQKIDQDYKLAICNQESHISLGFVFCLTQEVG